MTRDVIELPPECRAGRRLPPFGREVAEALNRGERANVFLFAGQLNWQRAQRRRASHGLGSALVLPQGAQPWEFLWPRVKELTVSWPDVDPTVYRSKLDLARAAIRDGVELLAIECSPEWLFIRGVRS